MAASLGVRKQNVTLDVVDRVEGILRKEGAAMSRNELLRQLAERGHATKRDRLNAALAHLAKHHIIHDAGAAGVVWLGRPSLKALERLARARTL